VPNQDHEWDRVLEQYPFWQKSFQRLSSAEGGSCQGAHLAEGNAFPAVWKDCAQQRFHNAAKEMMNVVPVLLSHQIDAARSIDSRNNGQYELLCPDLLLDFLRNLVAQ
jgi:hypothetical protein